MQLWPQWTAAATQPQQILPTTTFLALQAHHNNQRSSGEACRRTGSRRRVDRQPPQP